MAIRTIRIEGEDVLRKRSKEITKFDQSLWTVLDDMKETMYNADGVGIAAPQIGLLKRMFIVDVGEGPIEFINPEIIFKKGEQVGEEGCLSIPKIYGAVKRANHVRMSAYNRNGEKFEIEGKELMARAMLHEYDHLEGILFIDLVEGDLFEAK